MDRIPPRNLILKSTRKFETFSINFCQDNSLAENQVEFGCEGTYSPIFADIVLSLADKQTKELVRNSMTVTHAGAARLLRSAREEQRFGGIDHSEVRTNTTQVISSLVLAQLHPNHDFSFVNLEPHTIDTLKILAISHFDNSYTPVSAGSRFKQLSVV